MRHALLLLLLLTCVVRFAQAQQSPSRSRSITIGIEQDVLPYVFGGYFVGGWIGKEHLRLRTLTAKVHKPDILLKDGFTNNTVTAYAMLADYFLKEDWKGWYAGAGVVCWKNTIQTENKLSTAAFTDYLLNGSIGYNFKLYKNFYVSPWAGMHIRVAGDKNVIVDGEEYKTSLLNPEASVKFGWHF